MQVEIDKWMQAITILGVTIGLFGIIVAIAIIARKLTNLIRQLHTKYVLLEVTPTAFDDKSMEATSALFSALHSLGSARTLREKLLGIRHSFSVEILSTQVGGIRYIIRTPEHKSKTVQKTIRSYMNNARVNVIEDYLAENLQQTTLRFGAKKNYTYPLRSHEELTNHDPIGYITAALTQLNDDELIAMQIVFEPHKPWSASRTRNKILRNDTYLPNASNKLAWLRVAAKIINKINFGIMDAMSAGFHPTETYPKTYSQADRQFDRQMTVARGERPVRQLSYFEHEVVESISEKLKQPLFRSDVRFIVCSANRTRIKEHRETIQSAMGLYEVPKYQGFKLRKSLLTKRINKTLNERRLRPAIRPLHLSSSELASLFHFPNSESSKTEDVVKSLSKTLPAPLSLKGRVKLDVLLGENHHHGRVTPIGLTEAERQRHMYVIGGTGNGKTTMLKYQIVQDIKNGKGVAVVDPHGDLAEELLQHIPKERIKDVVYINPDDLGYPVGINLLELPKGLSGDDLVREKDLVTESTVSVLRKIFSNDDSGGHRIEYVLRNTIQTALTMEEANLFTIFRLINDKKFRKPIINNLQDADLKAFWKNELGKAGEMQKVKMSAGITAKIGRFLFSGSAKKMLEQNRSTVDFDALMNEKKILICNFSKGLLGEDTSMLFGVTILAKLQLASLRRARQAQVDRSSFYLYVDEFQNFATMSFVQMLSEARKYKLFLVMAEQSTQQQEDSRLVDIILANVGTVVAFRSGSPADERLILPLFKPYVDENELSNLPAYNFYARISAVHAQEPMSGVTVVLPDDTSESLAKEIIEHSRYTYAKSAKQETPKQPAKQGKPKQSKDHNKNKQGQRIAGGEKFTAKPSRSKTKKTKSKDSH